MDFIFESSSYLLGVRSEADAASLLQQNGANQVPLFSRLDDNAKVYCEHHDEHSSLPRTLTLEQPRTTTSRSA